MIIDIPPLYIDAIFRMRRLSAQDFKETIKHFNQLYKDIEAVFTRHLSHDPTIESYQEFIINRLELPKDRYMVWVSSYSGNASLSIKLLFNSLVNNRFLKISDIARTFHKLTLYQ